MYVDIAHIVMHVRERTRTYSDRPRNNLDIHVGTAHVKTSKVIRHSTCTVKNRNYIYIGRI